jgi:hypothetical protein
MKLQWKIAQWIGTITCQFYSIRSCGVGSFLEFSISVSLDNSLRRVPYYTSQNILEIKQQLPLNDSGLKLSLKQNVEHVSHAIDVYIDHKVS